MQPAAITLKVSGAEPASGSSAAVDVGQRATMLDELLLDVTVLSGTSPTLDVYVETSPSGSGPIGRVRRGRPV